MCTQEWPWCLFSETNGGEKETKTEQEKGKKREKERHCENDGQKHGLV